MPYTKEQLEDWVKGFKVGDDKKAELLKILADPELLPEIGNAVMRQSDYSRQMDEIRDERSAIATKQQEVLAIEDRLVAWREENNPKYEAALADATAAKAERDLLVNAYIAKGGSLADLGKPVEALPKPEDQPRADDGRYVSREDYEKTMKATVPALAQWTAQAMQIDREHFELTGQHPDLDKVLAEVYKGKSARDAWESTHGIPALRAAKQESDIEARVAAAVKDAETRVRTELALNPAARREDSATKGFAEALGQVAADPAVITRADAASRARAVTALDGFSPFDS